MLNLCIFLWIFLHSTDLRKDINSLNQEVSSPESIVQFQKRLITLRKHYENNDGSILMDYEITRRIYHKKSNGKNHLLWYDFLHSLNPIDPIDWRLGSCPERLFMLIKAPMLLVVTLMVPVVDFEQNKHGWSKLLNCMQMVLNPFLLITVVNCMCCIFYTESTAPHSTSSCSQDCQCVQLVVP